MRVLWRFLWDGDEVFRNGIFRIHVTKIMGLLRVHLMSLNIYDAAFRVNVAHLKGNYNNLLWIMIRAESKFIACFRQRIRLMLEIHR